MSRIFTTSGARLYIGSAMDAPSGEPTEADFASQAWTEIVGATNLGSAGDTAELVTSQPVGENRVRKAKGTRNAGSTQVVCALNYADPGQLAMIGAEKENYSYAFRLKLNDAPVPRSNTVTITIADPGVVSWTGHGLAAGDQVKFSTTGALPTGLTAGTAYYVVSPTTDSFEVAATKGGDPIETTGTQSGVHTATTVPTPSERLFVAFVMSAVEQYNEANSVLELHATLEIDAPRVRVQPTPLS
jgi:hypothetical protein